MKKIVCSFVIFLLLFLASTPAAPARDVIVVVKSRELDLYEVALKSFRRAVNGKGYDPVFAEYLLPEAHRERDALLGEIRKRAPRLVVTVGSAATAYVSKTIRDVPVTFCMVLNPLASGFVRSMSSSGNNLTGASLDIPNQTQFETLRALVPQVKRIGVIYNPQETEIVVQQAAKVARDMGLELVAVPIASPERVPEALRSLDNSVDALWSVADSTAFSSGSVEFILLHTLRNRIPFMGLSSRFVQAGALLALDADYQEVGAQCGRLAARILMGEQPSSLPITRPQTLTLHVNLKTAETIGLKVPAERLKGAVVIK